MSHRVRTDFRIQNWRLFPGFFLQNNNFFFQTQGYLLGDQQRRMESLFHEALQTYGRDWIRFDQNDKKFTYKALVVALKKTQDFLPFFQTLSLFSRLFPGRKNCWTNFKTFSRIQDSAQTLETPFWNEEFLYSKTILRAVYQLGFDKSQDPMDVWKNRFHLLT